MSNANDERELWFLVVGPFCWGRAKTIKQALKYARENAPSKGSPYYPSKGGLKFNAYSAYDDGICIDDMGTVYAKEGAELTRLGQVA